MPIGTIALVVGAAAAASSAGYAISAGSSQPGQPNLGAASSAMADVQARELPYIMAMEAAAQEGGSTLKQGYKQSTESAAAQAKLQKQLTAFQNELKGAQSSLADPNQNNIGKSRLNAQIKTLQTNIANTQKQLSAIPAGGGTVYIQKSTGNIVPASQALADFSGYGTAQVQGNIMTQEAQDQLNLAKEFDPQFIAQALQQEQEANPEGTQARNDMYNLIQQQINNPPQSPVANELESQIQEKVNAGANLTPEEQQALQEAVTSAQSAQGGATPAADYSQLLTTGLGGSQRQLSNAMAGETELASGQTPEDIQYRAEQQNLANLGAFINNQTPESQFKSLSGAQAGPTPVAQAQPLSTMPTNSSALGSSSAANAYGLQVQNALSQPNSWMTGLSAILGAANTAGALGYQPLGG